VLPRPAQYLLRFDDLCPTVCRERWLVCCALIREFGLHPILAVVPDNQDAALQLAPPDAGFWELMRAMERDGATVALHGYRHLCRSRAPSLLPLHCESEFAGVAAETQRQWIHEGLSILRGHGLKPKMWVAPRHGFDGNTLLALRAEGIEVLSDGFARTPFLRGGLTWIPQQLWVPVHKTQGLWTICLHPNTATDAQIAELRAFLRDHGGQFTSVERVLAAWRPAELTLPERANAEWRLLRIRLSRFRKQMSGRLQRRNGP
jgi:hypothetical protein